MGWTSFNMHQPVKEWFKKDFNCDEQKVLDVAIVQRNTLYAAMENVHDGSVFCAVLMLSWSPKSYYNFSFKSMSEFSGPCQVECPEKIFKLLTPLTGEGEDTTWAQRWRDSVKKVHEQRKALKKLGDFVFTLDEPIRFTNGGIFDTFKKEGRKIYAGRMHKGQFATFYRVRIGKLSNHKYNVIECNL